VPKNNIQQRAQSGSLMLSGLLDNLSSSEQLDLYRFLVRTGQARTLRRLKQNVARLWRVRPLLHTDEQVGENTWSAVISTVLEWKLSHHLSMDVTSDMVGDCPDQPIRRVTAFMRPRSFRCRRWVGAARGPRQSASGNMD
jgi:hypothetical protein